MKKVRALARAKKTIEEKQAIADYGSLADKTLFELYLYFKVQELIERRLPPKEASETPPKIDPLKELAEMEKWFVVLGPAFNDNDHIFFETLAKIAKFLSKGESNDVLAKKVLAAYPP